MEFLRNLDPVLVGYVLIPAWVVFLCFMMMLIHKWQDRKLWAKIAREQQDDEPR